MDEKSPWWAMLIGCFVFIPGIITLIVLGIIGFFTYGTIWSAPLMVQEHPKITKVVLCIGLVIGIVSMIFGKIWGVW